MNKLKRLNTKKGDIAVFTVLILTIVMMSLLFNISIKTNVDLRTSRDANLSQQAYNKAIKGAEAWIECASNPTTNQNPADLGICDGSPVVNSACNIETNNGVQSDCSLDYTFGATPFIISKATADNGTGKIVNRVVRVEFSN